LSKYCQLTANCQILFQRIFTPKTGHFPQKPLPASPNPGRSYLIRPVHAPPCADQQTPASAPLEIPLDDRPGAPPRQCSERRRTPDGHTEFLAKAHSLRDV
jgi:hypothetical protein